MKVIALTRTSSIGPSTRYRIEQYVPALERAGIEVVTRPLFGATWFAILERRPGPLRTGLKGLYSVTRLAARIGQVLAARASHADLVLVEQQLFPYLPAWVELLLWPRGKPTLVEFDDAIYLTPGHGEKLPRLWERASGLIVGNRFLADHARPHNPSVHVIPTTVDVTRYDRALAAQRARRDAARADDRLRVGWIGLRYNFPFLELVAEPLGRLDGHPELAVISSGLPERTAAYEGVELLHRPWSEATEADELGACDVGVMPLPDNEWARGKCGLKLLQCMAAGVPVVTSPVGVNADIVEHGVNGLLADTPEAWEAAFRQLAADPDLRSRLGEAGRRTVEAGFSLERGAEMLAKAYRSATLLAEERTPPSAPSAPRS